MMAKRTYRCLLTLDFVSSVANKNDLKIICTGFGNFAMQCNFDLLKNNFIWFAATCSSETAMKLHCVMIFVS